MKLLTSKTPSWLTLATWLLLASLVTFSFKKPTLFWQATNLNDLLLALSFFCFIIAGIKKQITISINKKIIIGFGIAWGSIFLGTLISIICFHIFAPDALREYARIFAAIVALFEIYTIGIHDPSFTRKAVLALIASSILIPFIFYAPHAILPFFLDESQSRFTGFLFDPNYFATLQILPTFLLLWISFIRPYGKNIAFSIAPFLLFMFSVASIIWSGSRGGILGLGIGLIALICFIFWKLPIRKSTAFTLCIIVGCIASFYILPTGGKTNVVSRSQRIVDPTTSTLTAGQDRTTIWKNALREIAKNPLGYGAGYGNVADIHNKTEGHKVAHNTILQILLTGGFILFIIAGMGSWLLSKQIIFSKLPLGELHYLAAALVGIGAAGLFLDSLWSRWIWVIIGLILVYLHHEKNQSMV